MKMEKKLTEHIVENMSRCRDYAMVLKFNFSGCDITLCLKMPYIEVLALSMNKITTLKSLVNFTRLKELYLRESEIASFDELKYLANAKSLTSLWLLDNPCSNAAGSKYRASVLRILPNLKKLDDVDVDEEELEAALRDECLSEVRSGILDPALNSRNCTPKNMAYRDMIEQCDRITTRIAKNLNEMLNSRRQDAMAPPDYLMPNVSSGLKFHAANSANCTSLKGHSNRLSAALFLIRDMDASQLETLVLAIHEQVNRLVD
ncbi:cilia- and flagella-associated protein 410 isoform X2 [Drosophila sechellia]|nr:cilia- and flagella-associated protein 410 isoform X2 [Drosophila sechellia]